MLNASMENTVFNNRNKTMRKKDYYFTLKLLCAKAPANARN